ncbi:hypothetical protein L9F63_008438, partial [Diploptera punctata]
SMSLTRLEDNFSNSSGTIIIPFVFFFFFKNKLMTLKFITQLFDDQIKYETSNGIKREEKGVVKNAGTADEALSVQGSYSYTGPDGKPVNLSSP